MAGEIGMAQAVTDGRGVTFAIGDVLQDGRYRCRLSVLGQPKAGRQTHAVAHGDPDILNVANGVWKVIDEPGHRALPTA